MNIFLADEQDDPVPAADVHRWVEAAMAGEHLEDDTEVTLIFVSEDQIAEYNGRFMNRQGPTDVLAFPLEQLTPGRVPVGMLNGPPVSLGDIIISPSTVRRQANEHGVAFEDELALIVVHGLLHLLGYDHQEDSDAEVMERREVELLAIVGRAKP